MKTIYRFFPPVAAVFAVVAACSGSGSSDASVPVALKADSITVNEILRPVAHAVAGDKVVVMGGGSEDLFYVYGMPDFKFLYSTGKSGEGPDDFGRCRFLSSDARDQALYVDEFSKRAVKILSVGDKAFYGKGQIALAKKDGIYYRERAVAGGGRWLLSTKEIKGDEFGRQYLCAIDVATGNITDSVMVHTLVSETAMKGGGVMVKTYNDVSVLTCGDAVAVSYSMVQRIDFYTLTKDGKFSHVRSVGDVSSSSEEVLERAKALEADKNAKGTMVCDWQATEKYLFVLEVEIKADIEARKLDFLSTRVKAYGWDGRAAGVFDLEKPATNVIISPDGGRIFAYNVVTDDFDRVYTYETGL